jgi:hypothetical protein
VTLKLARTSSDVAVHTNGAVWSLAFEWANLCILAVSFAGLAWGMSSSVRLSLVAATQRNANSRHDDVVGV